MYAPKSFPQLLSRKQVNGGKCLGHTVCALCKLISCLYKKLPRIPLLIVVYHQIPGAMWEWFFKCAILHFRRRGNISSHDLNQAKAQNESDRRRQSLQKTFNLHSSGFVFYSPLNFGPYILLPLCSLKCTHKRNITAQPFCVGVVAVSRKKNNKHIYTFFNRSVLLSANECAFAKAINTLGRSGPPHALLWFDIIRLMQHRKVHFGSLGQTMWIYMHDRNQFIHACRIFQEYF